MVEHATLNRVVVGSNPTWSTTLRSFRASGGRPPKRVRAESVARSSKSVGGLMNVWYALFTYELRLGEPERCVFMVHKKLELRNYIISILAVAVNTAIGKSLGSIVTPVDQVLLYIVTAVIVAAKLGRGPSILYTILSVTSFNFFFIEPLYTFTVYDDSYWFTFVVMLTTGLVISYQSSQLRIAENEKLRNILLSSISHDLRTPLSSIMGASTSIALDSETMPRETIKNLAESISHESSALNNIVTNVLQLTRFEVGVVTLNRQDYFIDELIGAVLSRMETALSKYNLITNNQPELPMVAVDGILIDQVVTNLLSNAMRHTPQGGSIIIDAKQNNNEVMVTLTDSGVGISKGDEEKIFEKFYTVSDKDGEKGSGLGLTICREIINAHGGRIWAKNTEHGAEFTFVLPAVSPKETKI